jgi:hypothetical protein
VPVAAAASLDLTRAPFAAAERLWTADDYGGCQRLATAARAIGAQAIRSKSARDPLGGTNVAILDPAVFRERAPRIEETWHLRFDGADLVALAAFPSALRFTFGFATLGLSPP